MVRTFERLLSGDLESARERAGRAIGAGSHTDPAAAALGRVAQARLVILDGEVERGLALLDDAGTGVMSGDLDPMSTGVVYCELVCALQGMAQYDLAEQWTDAMERWARTNAIGSLRGRCRVHRAEILRLRGQCANTEQQVLLACEELRPYVRRELGWPLTELGRIRLRRGDLAGAEEALLAAHRLGWDPEPVLSLLRLPPTSELRRAPLLDARAKQMYRRRLADIEDDIGEARGGNDLARQGQAEFERDFLIGELARAVGLGGRDRHAGAASERARAAVAQTLRKAIGRLRDAAPALGDHLGRTIRTGTYCAYVPDPHAPSPWSVRPKRD